MGDADVSLLRAWTIKEALYKGAGIAGLPLKEIPLAMPEAMGGSMGQNKVSVRGVRSDYMMLKSRGLTAW